MLQNEETLRDKQLKMIYDKYVEIFGLPDDDSPYWNAAPLLNTGADVFIIYGERSNGKTYNVAALMLIMWSLFGYQSAYIRRTSDEVVTSKAETLFDNLIYNDKMLDLTGGEWNGVKYNNRKRTYNLTYKDEDGNLTMCDKSFCYSLPLSKQNEFKGTSFPGVHCIILDEFMTRERMLVNEVDYYWKNMLSTILRKRHIRTSDPVFIFLVANTVNYDSDYFRFYGLKGVRDIPQGTLTTIVNSNGLKVAVEYTDHKADSETDPHLTAANGLVSMEVNGSWYEAKYPSLPPEYLKGRTVYRYFISYHEDCLTCEIKALNGTTYTYVTRSKITDVIEGYTIDVTRKPNEIIFCSKTTPDRSIRRFINRPSDDLTKTIWSYYVKDIAYFEDGRTGEIFRNYLNNAKVFDIMP